jgi:DNA-binding XRE family transcriptional regulator
VVILTFPRHGRDSSRVAKTASIARLAAPREGGPSVSQRCTVGCDTPNRAANVFWLSPSDSRARRKASGAIDMSSQYGTYRESQYQSDCDLWNYPEVATAHERLARARLLAGYETATEAADAIGVNRPTYIHHENGTRGFQKHADRYAKFFRVSLEWLVTGRGEPQMRSLDARVRSLSEADQREIRDFIAFLESRTRARKDTA